MTVVIVVGIVFVYVLLASAASTRIIVIITGTALHRHRNLQAAGIAGLPTVFAIVNMLWITYGEHMASDEEKEMETLYAEFVIDRGKIDPMMTPLGVEREAFKMALKKYSAITLGRLLLKMGMSPNDLVGLTMKKQ